MSALASKLRPIWIPRILLILFTLFLSLFALDSFTGEDTLTSQLVGFGIHLLPSLLLVMVLALSWRHPALAGWLLVAISIAFTLYFHTYTGPIESFLLISVPPFVTGLLFLLFASAQGGTEGGGEQPPQHGEPSPHAR